MTNFTKAEEIGFLEDEERRFVVLGSRNNGKLQQRSVYLIRGSHSVDVIPFYNGEPINELEIVKNITDLSGLQVRKQYVTHHKEYGKLGMRTLDSSVLEFDDKTQTQPLMTDCAFLFSLPTDRREILVEDVLYDPMHIEEVKKDIEKFKKELKIQKIRNLSDLMNSFEGQALSRRSVESIRIYQDDLLAIQNNAKFKSIDSLSYNMREKEKRPKIDESSYSEWRLCDVEHQIQRGFNPMIPFLITETDNSVAVLKEEGKDIKGQIIIPNNIAALRGVAKWVDNEEFKSFVAGLEKDDIKYPKKCSHFISEFLEKSKISAEQFYFNGNISRNFAIKPNGEEVERFLIDPEVSYVTLNNGRERRTVESPTSWTFALALKNSNALKIKKAPAENKPPTYVS